jgi:hypothetical protein
MEDVELETLLGVVIAHPIPEHVSPTPRPLVAVATVPHTSGVLRRIVAVVRSRRARR